MSKIEKTIEYRKARWFLGQHTLETVLRGVLPSFTTQKERSITNSVRQTITSLRIIEDPKFGVFIHFGKYIDGQSIGIIPMQPATEVVVGEKQPDPDENFLNKGFLALVRGNDVLCIDCGREAASLRNYLSALFVKSGCSVDQQSFELIRVAHVKSVEKIKKIGVKKVELKLSMSEATLDYIDAQKKSPFFDRFTKPISQVFSNFFAKDENLEQLRSSKHGSILISLNVPRKELESVRDSFDNLGSQIVEDETAEGYTVRLVDDTVIEPHQMSVRKSVRLQEYANFVSIDDAYAAMKSYLNELDSEGYTRI